MLKRLRILIQKTYQPATEYHYPAQFWLLFWGLLISTVGSSMIWPFLMIYVSERLELPLAIVASLMTLNAGMGLLFSFLAGPVTDRFGRKWVMAISLAVNGVTYLFMSQATTFPQFAVLMALTGAFNPLYRVGADAMMADLVPPEHRPDAYSLLRASNNIGVAVGPMLGGLIASTSYTIAFYCAAAGLMAYSLLVTFRAVETLPRQAAEAVRAQRERFGGYGRILRDRAFMPFVGMFTLTQMCAAIMWVLLSVYAKQNYGVSESRFGLLPTTNALMVVFFQISVTQWTKRRRPFAVLALGSLFYAVGVGSVALGQGLGAFWVSMVVMTVGELIVSPTATTLAANLAPADMRGRYMSLYGLTWNIAVGVGPVIGGLLNDRLGPVSIWYGAGLVGAISTLGFLILTRRTASPAAQLTSAQ